MTLKKTVNAVISVILAAVLLVGCSGGSTAVVYDESYAVNKLTSQAAASNALFELSWNNEGKFVSLYDKTAEKLWSTVPYEYFESGGTSDNVNSPISITVANAAKAQWDSVSGYAESVKKDRVSAEKIDNGIKVTYYFDSYKISIPVRYELFDKGLKMSVFSSEIVEAGDRVLLSISLAPFMCSVVNASEGAYLFVPSGSGGLMYTDERAEGTRKYTAEVYGTDGSRLVPEEAVDQAQIYMPVYGVKEDNTVLLAVISEGAECAEIHAEAGNRRTGYSTVYSTFYLRGYDVVETDQWLWGYRDLSRISDERVNADLAIDFYPLSGDNADYNGMAKLYRKYLQVSNKSRDNTAKAPAYSLNILGGVTYKSASWGIPHNELYTLTTFKDVRSIITGLNKSLGTAPVVTLQGFTATGIDIGKIGGGFAFANSYGTKKDLSVLLEACKADNTMLSFDFDIVRFNKFSNGFSYTMDAAKSATLRTAEKYGINLPLRSYNEEGYHLLKRAEIDSAVDKLISFADKQSITAVGLSTLTSLAYSDFDEEKFSCKGNMALQVAENIARIQSKGISVYASNANAYAAAAADVLLNVPDGSGDYFSIDKSVPFYQLVFCGSKPMYSSALNLSENISKAVMNAVSTGVRFGFTVAENYDIICATSKTEKLYGTKFFDTENTIIDLVSQYAAFYEGISGSGISSYEFLENGITKTVFENGTAVYANRANTEVETDMGVFEPYGIKISQ